MSILLLFILKAIILTYEGQNCVILQKIFVREAYCWVIKHCF